MFSCLQILEAFLWFVLITLLNVTLIILTLSVSRLLNLLLMLVAVLLVFNPQSAASIRRLIAAESGWRLAERTGCFGCHGPEGKEGTATPGRSEKTVPSFRSLMMYAKNETEVREWIRD